MLSNGPGDPAENVQIIKNIGEMLDTGIPTFGICLGHQLTALAAGGKTCKLKYGHRGANQPVSNISRARTFITSQNHGYAVMGDTMPADVGTVSYFNANDGTCEGMEYSSGTASRCSSILRPTAAPRTPSSCLTNLSAASGHRKE